MKTATLLIDCADKPGIIAKVSNFLFSHNCNIIQSDQYSTGLEGGHFFMRVQFAYDDSRLARATIRDKFRPIAEYLEAQWQVFYDEEKKQMGILVSKYDHCLLDILYRWKTGELTVDIPMVISNHPDLRKTVEDYGLKFVCLPAQKDNKQAQEKQILKLVKACDFLVLARYMQILSPDFLSNFGKQIINIHHSFLPGFKGANPYKQAFERGVKLIGATAHYVTANLDEGPIIAQEVIKVTHRDEAESMTRKGRDIEKLVLAQALRAQLENRIIEYQGRTIVF